MPVEHTADGRNRSPALNWTKFPEGTKTFAILCEDPDAPREEPFVHWLLWNIPAGAMGLPLNTLPEGITKGPHPSEVPTACQGTNDFGNPGYDGPAPPRGHGIHHYHFKVYAVDQALELKPGAGKAELLRAIQGHVLAEGEITGTYSR